MLRTLCLALLALRHCFSKPIVSFRLDDVQAWWCKDVAEFVIDTFIEENVPVNIGVIGVDLDKSSMGTFLAGISSSPFVEIESKSYQNIPYGGKSVSWQEADLKSANDMITGVTSKFPLGFIPPGNEYDESTATAMLASGISTLSAQCTAQYCTMGSDVVAPNLTWNGLTMLPAGAVMGNVSYWRDGTQSTTLAAAIASVESQIARQGFSVVMLRPIEFALRPEDCYVLNTAKMSVLKSLLEYGKANWDMKSLENAKLALTGQPEVTAPPAAAPTPAASRSPTSHVVPKRERPVVSFRIDDIQAYWCSSIAQTVVDIFLEESVPLNLGIIGISLDESASMGSYLSRVVDSPLIEVASHSFKHKSFGGHDYTWQESDLHQADTMIKKVTAKFPRGFIPPENDYDVETATAMLENNLTLMSAECTSFFCPAGSDIVAPNLTWNGLTMLPAGAVLGNRKYWNDYSLPANLTQAIGWVENQLERQGFSVIMLHPVEFAVDYGPCTQLDPAKVQVLRALMAHGKAHWNFQTFTGAVAALTESPSSPTPAPATPPSTAISQSPTYAIDAATRSSNSSNNSFVESSAFLAIVIPLSVLAVIVFIVLMRRKTRVGKAPFRKENEEVPDVEVGESPIHTFRKTVSFTYGDVYEPVSDVVMTPVQPSGAI